MEKKAHDTTIQKKISLSETTEFFRVVHTVKGNSESLGFKHLGSLCHELESEISDLLEELKKKKNRSYNKKKNNSLVASEIDNIKNFWSRLTNYSNTKERLSVHRFLEELLSQVSSQQNGSF